MSDLHCPKCDFELDMSLVLKSKEDHDAFDRLVMAVGVPIARRVLDYIDLHKPAQHRLSLTKKTKLIRQLDPDLQRQAITRNGLDWPAPHLLWAQAIDQMLATRDAGRLDLPLKGHGYLYAVIQGLSDKAEGAQERQTEADRRAAAQTTRATVQVRGQAMGLGDALEVVYGGRDPALAALDHSARHAAPMPAEVRAKLAALRGRTPQANPEANPNTP